MNNVNLIGRLTADPEVKELQNGVKICNFTLAVRCDYKNDDGEYESDFFRCVAWRNQAEFLGKYFAKGNQVGVSGRLQTREWIDQNNNKRSQTEVVVSNITFIEAKKETGNTALAKPKKENDINPIGLIDSEMDEELPF